MTIADSRVHLRADSPVYSGNGHASEQPYWEILARVVMRWTIPLNVIVSFGNFHTDILPEDLSSLQQIASLAMWTILIGAAGFSRPRLRLEFNTDAAAFVLFYGLAIISVAWTALEPAALMKSAALLITTTGACFMVTRLSLDEIVAGSTLGLFMLAAVSIGCALLYPDIGIDKSWMHGGQWQGVFDSKQSLGVVGAYLMFFACYRQLTRHGWLEFFVLLSGAAVAEIASGSRGGGALALAACATLYASRLSVRWTKVFACLPFVMCLMACALIYYFYSTGYPALRIFGEEIDFTERTFIWQYALAHLDQAPWFGYGLNGFWTVKEIYDQYLQDHTWVLDNYHNGYIAVLVETGLVGLLLLITCGLLFAAKILWLIDNRMISRPHAALIVGYATLNFQINFTEGVFLRSTNYAAVLLVALFIATFTPMTPHATSARTPGA